MQKPRETRYSSGDLLFRQGDMPDHAFYLLRGRVRLYREILTGPVDLDIFKRHDIVGETALLDGGPRSATAVAETDIACLAVDRATFQAAMDSCPETMRTALQTLIGYTRWALPDDPDRMLVPDDQEYNAESVARLLHRIGQADFKKLVAAQSVFVRGVFRSVVRKAASRLLAEHGQVEPV